MKNPIEPIYRETMVVLYSICRIGWGIYLKHIDGFVQFSGNYTEQYGNDALKAVEAAAALPDSSARRGATSASKIDLTSAAKKGTRAWKKMARFISKAFPAGKVKTMKEIAGNNHYIKATKENWSEVSALLIAGANFISENSEALMKGDKGMPATFPQEYAIIKARFETMYSSFSNTKTGAGDGTSNKIEANNAIYTNLTEMLQDAQVIFDDKYSVKKQFTYAAIRRMVTKDVVSGIHFTVRDKVSKLPVKTAVISADEDKKDAVNDDGVLDMRLSKGEQQVMIVAPGYQTCYRSVTVDSGIMHRVEILLVAVEE